jgi:hypothetical protein
MIEVENVLHVEDERRVILWRDFPVVREMRFEGVFLAAVERFRERSTRSRSRRG